MKTVIVYYSQSNNTRVAAEILKSKLGADIVELKESKKGNPLQALLKLKSKLIGDPWKEVQDANLVYLMFPIWAGNSVPAINAFVNSEKSDFKGKEVILVTFQADPSMKSSIKVREYIGNLVLKHGGKIKASYGMVGGNMNVFIGDDKLKEQIDKVKWTDL
ncbi:MAG: hypothetical protein WBI17_06175 [Clostridiaceae bacterium]